MTWRRREDPRRFWVDEVVPGALARRRRSEWRCRMGIALRAVQAASGWLAQIGAVGAVLGVLALLVLPLAGRGIFPPPQVVRDFGLVCAALGLATFAAMLPAYAATRRLVRWLQAPGPLGVSLRGLPARVGRGLTRALVLVPVYLVVAVLWAVGVIGLMIARFPSMLGRAVLAPVFGWLPWSGADDR